MDTTSIFTAPNLSISSTLYHGTLFEFDTPSLTACKRYGDFGRGFYTTTSKQQAILWASRKHKRDPLSAPVVNIYSYTSRPGISIKKFEGYSLEWLDFVINSRNKHPHTYAIVVGPMADSNIMSYLQEYAQGRMERESLLKELQFKRYTNQVCFCTEFALTLLTPADKYYM